MSGREIRRSWFAVVAETEQNHGQAGVVLCRLVDVLVVGSPPEEPKGPKPTLSAS
jgi:hypothetical protein